MAEHIYRIGRPIDAADMDIVGTVNDIIDNGLAIYGETQWLNGREKRVMKVIEEPVFHDFTPVLGYGRGDTADQALLRALYTYAMDKPRRYIGPDDLPESSTSPLSITDDLTQLDIIVTDSDFRVFGQDDQAVAESTLGRIYEGEQSPRTIVGSGDTAVAATENLVHEYPIPGYKNRRLPVTLLWDFTKPSDEIV